MFTARFELNVQIQFRLNFALILIVIIPLVKGKAIPLQTWAGPDVSRRLRLPDFKTIGT